MSLERDRQVLAYVHSDVLQKGEKLIWTGRPSAGRVMRLDFLFVFFGVFYLVFSTFWVGTAFAAAGLFFAAFGIPFVVIGLFLVSAPLRNRLLARRTYYAVTDQRVLIVTAGRRYKVRAYAARDITDYQRSDSGNGRGDIRLRKVGYRRFANPFAMSSFSDGLWGVDDVKAASDAVTAVMTA